MLNGAANKIYSLSARAHYGDKNLVIDIAGRDAVMHAALTLATDIGKKVSTYMCVTCDL